MKKDLECPVCYLNTVSIDGPTPRVLFHSYEGMRIHIRRAHETDEWKYNCRRCESKFVSFYGLEMHMRDIHCWKGVIPKVG